MQYVKSMKMKLYLLDMLITNTSEYATFPIWITFSADDEFVIIYLKEWEQMSGMIFVITSKSQKLVS